MDIGKVEICNKKKIKYFFVIEKGKEVGVAFKQKA